MTAFEEEKKRKQKEEEDRKKAELEAHSKELIEKQRIAKEKREQVRHCRDLMRAYWRFSGAQSAKGYLWRFAIH
jgi:hypothetical protein